ncbi:Protein ASP-1 protein7 [Aphelenchoides avenae]|nr:Protein ASP-1 protein7 [Aphelenchus avenae]
MVSCVRSDTVQLPVYGSGAFFYEHYPHNSDPLDPKFCDPYQTNYSRSQCYNLVEYLTIQVGIGHPEQTLNLTLDGNAFESFVFSDTAVDSTCSGGAASGRPIEGRHLFRSSRSTTFRSSGASKLGANEDRYFQNNCQDIDNPEAESLMGKDDFKVAGKSALNVPFVVAKNVQSTVQPFWPSDGVFSLSATASAAYGVASSIGQPQATLYMKRANGHSSGDRIGTLTFGGRDAKNCDKTWISLPHGSKYDGDFDTKVNSVSLGSTVVYTNFSVASLDVGYPTIGMPYSMFPLIGNMLKATFDPKTQFYLIPCDSVKDAPSLTFHLEGVNYVIPAGDYIRNLVPRSDNMCTVLVESFGVTEDWPNGQKVEAWVLGLPAMRAFCWNFDFNAKSVSVAKAMHDV